MKDPSDRSGRSDNQGKSASKIEFNGMEYECMDDMSTYARNLYEQSLRTAEMQSRESVQPQDRSSGRTRPEPAFSPAAIVALIVLVVVAVLAWYLFT